MIKHHINEVKSAYNGTKELGLLVQGLFLVLLGVFLFLMFTVAALFPFAVIWAINVLFMLSIQYSFSTWLAVIVLYLVFLRRRK